MNKALYCTQRTMKDKKLKGKEKSIQYGFDFAANAFQGVTQGRITEN